MPARAEEPRARGEPRLHLAERNADAEPQRKERPGRDRAHEDVVVPADRPWARARCHVDESRKDDETAEPPDQDRSIVDAGFRQAGRQGRTLEDAVEVMQHAPLAW